jgi:pimeloyl-ACP methyl ester carboxylesterase
MARSILAYLQHAPEAPGRLVVALHGNAEDAPQGLALGRECFPDDLVVAPSSPRPMDPRYGDTRSAHERKLWFFVQGGFIEPTLFGETLRQVELLLHDHVERLTAGDATDPSVWLVGRTEGGTLALALAAIWPDLVDGVIAVDAVWPEVPGWHPEPRDAASLEVRLLRDRRDGSVADAAEARIREHFERVGAVVTTGRLSDDAATP